MAGVRTPACSSAAAGAARAPRRTLLPLVLCALSALCRAAAGASYDPWTFNKACRYSATNIPPNLFKNGIDSGSFYMFPLESSRAVDKYERPWEACFGPKETYSLAAIAAGWKLPCKYKLNDKGNYDFEEEHACDVLVKANCYCYSLDRFVGSYCEPGLGGTGKSFELPVDNCTQATAGVVADGGKLVDRDIVYNKPPPAQGHYIALAVKPSSREDATGDFHFWRLDSNGGWSYKAGDTLVRNTLRDGTPIKDIERDARARGDYTEFCGHFHVIPKTHKLKGNDYWYSDIPSRHKQWRLHGVKGSVQTLANLPAGWLAAYSDYFAESGWEDAPNTPAPWFAAKERAFSQRAFSRRSGAAAAPARRAGGEAAAAVTPEKALQDVVGAVGGVAGGAIGGAAHALASAAEGVARSIPHWYSVRPPSIV